MRDRAEGARRVYYIDPDGLGRAAPLAGPVLGRRARGVSKRSRKPETPQKRGRNREPHHHHRAGAQDRHRRAPRRSRPSRSSPPASTAGGRRPTASARRRCAESIIEPYVGGRWYTTHEDGSRRQSSGTCSVWQPPKRFVVSWEISADWKPDARAAFTSEVEVRFVPEGDGRTRVEVEHRDFERMGGPGGEKMRKDVDGGWPGLLELFAAEAREGGAASERDSPFTASPGSPFGRAVLMALEEKGARYRLARVAPGTLRSTEHLALSSLRPRAGPRARRLPPLRDRRRSCATSTACCRARR